MALSRCGAGRLKISVIIPTHNRAEETNRAILSILRQTLPPSEIIVVDDASGSPFRTAHSGSDKTDLRVLRLTANSGAAVARQTGIDAATGDFVAFLDSDDEWMPDKLAAQVPLLAYQQDSLLAVATGWRIRFENNAPSKIRIPVGGSNLMDFASGCWFSPGSTVVLPRSVFAKVGPLCPDLRRLEDYEWFLRFGRAGGVLDVVETVGATISVGRRGRVDLVEAACDKIQALHGHLDSPAFRYRMNAYLHLERAAAARNDHRWAKMLRALTWSLVLRPRRTVPLRRWWYEAMDS